MAGWMRIRATLGFCCGLCLANLGVAGGQTLAPGGPGVKFHWASAAKQGVGTAFEAYPEDQRFKTGAISRAWYSVAEGVLTETYWPTIDRAQTKDTQLLVVDGQGKMVEERKLSQMRVVPQPHSPMVVIESKDEAGHFILTKKVWSDPDRDGVLVAYEVQALVPNLRFYVLHKPAVGNSGKNDTARVWNQQALTAHDGRECQALLSNVGFVKSSAGFMGKSDGWQDLAANGVMDWAYDVAGPGNVALTGQLNLPPSPGKYTVVLALGFGYSLEGATEVATQALANAGSSQSCFEAQWREWLDSLKPLQNPLTAENTRQCYRRSLMVLKTHEDKSAPGAFIASLSVPWGEQVMDDATGSVDPRGQGGYHLIWPRDLVQQGLALLYAGDRQSPLQVARYLKKVQCGPNSGEYEIGWRRWPRDGSWQQNTWVDGVPYWSGLQMDQTAFPIVLVWHLAKSGLDVTEFKDMVCRAARFLVAHGPESQMERWEEIHGYSPSNIAIASSALVVGAALLEGWEEKELAQHMRQKADEWVHPQTGKLEQWLYTTSGAYGNQSYFVRIEGASDASKNHIHSDPNDEATFHVANGGGLHREKDVVDGGFLELVRYGVRPMGAITMKNTLLAVESTLKVEIPGHGPCFYRYNFDGYGNDTAPSRGQLWPLLTGERGMAALTEGWENCPAQPDLRTASYYQKTMENFANAGGMLPEQVFATGVFAGKGTQSATPLAWAHAEYITLSLSIDQQKNLSLLAPVKARWENFFGHKGKEADIQNRSLHSW